MHAVHQPHLDPFVGLPYNLFVVWPKALTLGNCILATLAADQVLRKYYFQGSVPQTECGFDLVQTNEMEDIAVHSLHKYYSCGIVLLFIIIIVIQISLD